MSNTRKFAYKQFQFSEEQLNLIKKYSQQELIKMTGLSQSIVSELLYNLPKDYRISTLSSLAEGFGMDLGDFLTLGRPLMSKEKAEEISNAIVSGMFTQPVTQHNIQEIHVVQDKPIAVKETKVNKKYGHY